MDTAFSDTAEEVRAGPPRPPAPRRACPAAAPPPPPARRAHPPPPRPQVLARLGVDLDAGLAPERAAQLRAVHGRNELAAEPGARPPPRA
jgi:hypothetical protein